MLQPAQSNAQKFPSTPIPAYTPVKTVTAPLEQATIGRSLVIKGDITGAEPLYIDGQVEGTITLSDHRVTVGRNGNVTAQINAKEVVIMGKVTGNIECSDRLDIRGEGTLIGDVVTERISVEDGAVMSGNVQVRAQEKAQEKAKTKAAAAGASA
jgi:cytoskeletal protein CcmA (bactofilin family)